jgi:hypothetical protein
MSAKYAVPCKVCGGYYPGDCTCDQETCMCDGCKSLRHQNNCRCSPIEVCDECLLLEGHWGEDE